MGQIITQGSKPSSRAVFEGGEFPFGTTMSRKRKSTGLVVQADPLWKKADAGLADDCPNWKKNML